MKSSKGTALFIGLGYLIIFTSGFFANFYTLQGILADGNPQLTLENIASQLGHFQLGIASFSLMVIVDILLAFPLFKLLKSVDRNCAFTSSLVRLINGLIFLIALVNLFKIASITQSGTATAATVSGLLEAFNTMWNVGLLFFGVHLIMLGWLMVKSLNFPGFIGLLLQIAGLTYLADSGAHLYWTPYQEYRLLFERLVIGGGIIGEFSFTIWLLIKGIRIQPKAKPKNVLLSQEKAVSS